MPQRAVAPFTISARPLLSFCRSTRVNPGLTARAGGRRGLQFHKLGEFMRFKWIIAGICYAAVASRGANIGADWPMYNRDLAGTRYSPLTEINTTNVAKL